MFDLRSVLALPGVYRFFARLLSSNYREVYLGEYVRPAPGARVLDLGCGPGDVLAHLPDVDYLGIDYNPKYITAAQSRFGARGAFRCEDVADVAVREPGAADIVMANGLLHHLTDDEVLHLLAVSRQALKPGGRLATFDGCYVPNQSRVTRFLLGMDRGRFVRTQEAYVALAREVFDHVESHIRHDLLRIPYTHHIMICTASASAENPLRHSA